MRTNLHDAMAWVLSRDHRLLSDLIHRLFHFDLPVADAWLEQDARLLSPVQAARAVDSALAVQQNGRSIAAALLEAQLSKDDEKRYAWPGYLGATISRFRCPTVLCIVTCKKSVADWIRTIVYSHPFDVARIQILGPAEWLALARQYPDDPIYRLMAWACGDLHDEIEEHTKRILSAIQALDSAIGRGYLYFMMAVAQSLPSPHQEFIMQNIKSYQSLFPIHDIEFEWLEKGIEQGIEQGIERGIEQGKTEGMLEQAKQTLASLDAEAAQNMAECTEISAITAAINAAVERLKSSNTRPN